MINRMYIGPWQEFRLAKILRTTEQSKPQLVQNYFSNSPTRALSTKPFPEIKPRRVKVTLKRTEISFRLPTPPLLPSLGDHALISAEVQTDGLLDGRRSYMDDITAESKMSYGVDSSFYPSSPLKRRRVGKQLSLTPPPKSSMHSFYLLQRNYDGIKPALSFENSALREIYPPLMTKATLRDQTMKRRSRKLY